MVLCDLEGHTHEQAARDLGWPVGTVKSRLSRGRERLRGRLLRRGLAPDGVLMASALRPDGPLAPISSAIVDTTVVAATRFLTVRSMVRGSAASLAQGVLRSMITTQWLKAASILLVAGATVAGVDLLAQKGTSGAQAQSQENPAAKRVAEAVAYPVKTGELTVRVVERGSLEQSHVSDMYCNVEGGGTIIRLVAEGARVKKGQVVWELDSSALKSQLISQTTAKKRAEAAYQNARLVSEIAELAVKEYEQVSSKLELEVLKEDIAASQLAILKAKGRLERTRSARKRLDDALARTKGASPTVDIVTDLDLDDRLEAAEKALESEERSLGRAKAKLEILEKYTRERTTKGLIVEVERRRDDELTRQEAWEIEKSKEAKLRKSLENCVFNAPFDGLVVHANDPSRNAGRPQPQIEEGATVRERQKIGYIIDTSSPMLVNAKVHESLVEQDHAGTDRQYPGQRLPRGNHDRGGREHRAAAGSGQFCRSEHQGLHHQSPHR